MSDEKPLTRTLKPRKVAKDSVDDKKSKPKKEVKQNATANES